MPASPIIEIAVPQGEIDEYQGFGWEVDLDRVAEVMGGRVVLDGNVSPLLILQGTPAEVKAAALRVLEKLGRHRGLIVQDGNNIAPGSPLENINALHQAAVEHGPIS